MSQSQQTKIDLIVSMAGAAPADAKKLLDHLKEIEKTEKEIGKAAEKHRQELEKAQKAAQARLQKGMGVVGGALSGGAMGAAAAMGGPVGMAVGVIAAAEQGLTKLARAAEVLATANTTLAQKQRMLIDEFVPFGASLNKLSDAIRGITQQIFQRNQEYAINIARTDIQARGNAVLRGVGSEYATAQARAGAIANSPMPVYQSFDRGTVAGMHAYGEQAIMLPAREAARSSGIEAQTARAAANFEANRESQMRARLAELEGRRGGLNDDLANQRHRENILAQRNARGDLPRNLGLALTNPFLAAGGLVATANRSRNETGINAAAASVQENEREIAAQTAALQEQILKSKEQGVRAAEAESRHRRDLINIQKAELEQLKQKEQRMSAIQQAVGGMSRGQFAASARAVEQVRRRGIGNVSAQTAALAAQAAPEFIGRQREALGGQRLEALRGRMGAEAFGEVYGRDFSPGNTLAETRRQVDKVQAEVQVAISLDERTLATEIVKTLEPVFQRLIEVINSQVRGMESDIRAGAVRSSNATNGSAAR